MSGTSQTGIGVYGSSNDRPGVYAVSNADVGLYGTSLAAATAGVAAISAYASANPGLLAVSKTTHGGVGLAQNTSLVRSRRPGWSARLPVGTA